MDSSSSVDTLVYQLEDDDASVRWDTIQKLRKRIAVERTQFPVRNPRRFLHCLRRRLSDDAPHVARDALLLLSDVIDVLHDDVDQILSSILPHLLPRLICESDGHFNQDGVILHEETFAVFRKYAIVANDLPGVAGLLVDMGLAHSRADVREAVLEALARLLDERYGRRTSVAARKGSTRVDTKLFTALTQAIVPALEDADEGVVVAAEEAIARIRVLWGDDGFEQATEYLGADDLATLKAHSQHIEQFVAAAAGDVPVASSLSNSQVMKLRASLAAAPPSATLRFGFVPAEVVDALRANTGNANAEWKKRTAAVEQLYAAAKQADAAALYRILLARSTSKEFVQLIEILVRLLQDIDVHLVKRTLQIQRILFAKLYSACGNDVKDEVDGWIQCFDRVLPSLVETAANFAEDGELASCIYGLLQTIFGGGVLTVAEITRLLSSSMRHRRLQIREEAFKVWIALLLTSQKTVRIVLDQEAVDVLGRGLGDSSSRVRYVAREVAVVLEKRTGEDVTSALEHQLDDYTLERIDLEALDNRLRQRRCASLLQDGQVQLPEHADGGQSSDQLVRSGKNEPRTTGRPSTELLIGHSELQAIVHPHSHGRKSEDKQHGVRDIKVEAVRKSDVTRSHSHDPWNELTQDLSNEATTGYREVASAPGEPIASKLEALKRKAQLKKSVSSKQMTTRTGNAMDVNPQEGEVDFSSSRIEEEGNRLKSSPARPLPNSRNPLPRANNGEARRSSHQSFSPREQGEYELSNLSDGPTTGTRVLEPMPSPDDRPIRPLRASEQVYFEENEDDQAKEILANKKRANAAMSLATKKRLEAKRLQEQQQASAEVEARKAAMKPTVEEEEEVAAAPARPISLATRKRLENKAKTEAQSTPNEEAPALKRPSAIGAMPSGLGKQEPRYLEAHEVQPLKDPKQDAAKILSQLRSADWEANFEALSTVRRLATHHSKVVEDKIHSITLEILNHVPNLRSSVAKNALLALDTMLNCLGKLMDPEVEAIVPVLMKRCTDSNTFVCESISASIKTVVLNCSTARVVSAVSSHLSSRAPAIRREVARSMLTVLAALADQVHVSKELPSIMAVVGKSLEDSHNEVRDAAKESIVYLFQEQQMDGAKIKKLLPSSVHAKVDAVLSNKHQDPRRRATSVKPPIVQNSKEDSEIPAAKAASSKARRSPGMDPEELLALTRRLESGNWKDRFDALAPLVQFVSTNTVALCETGKVTTVFDSIINRLEDGNAKVVTLMLELLPSIISSLGNGMEQVLSSFVPALAKGLTANNPKQVSLTQAAIQTLCKTVEARLLCQHVAAVARHANARVKPMMIEFLIDLSASGDDKNQFALTKNVLPLALDLLKESKSEVKEVNARLLRVLYRSLGQSMFHASVKLSDSLQDKLKAILTTR